jgi:hypothetical protein
VGERHREAAADRVPPFEGPPQATRGPRVRGAPPAPYSGRMRLVSAFAAVALLVSTPPAGSAERAAASFTLEQVKAVVEEYVSARARDAGGVFILIDDKTGEELKLELKAIALVSVERLWHIHDASHRVKRLGDGWFACANFHPVGEPDAKRYDVDLRLAARDGKLEVIEVVIHQEPRLVNGTWTWVPRFTLKKLDDAKAR